MTYEYLTQRVYDILDMPVQEAKRLGYSEKIYREVNEALFTIAHTISPFIREYKIRIEKNLLPAKVTMPTDFISFFDDQNCYLDGKNFILVDFIGRDGVILSGKEVTSYCPKDILTYSFYYNALYPKLVDGGQYYELIDINLVEPVLNDKNYSLTKVPVQTNQITDETHFDIPDLIANCVPHFVVAQLLAQDDKIRAATEMNSFEILMARINVEQNERQREYRSSKGWY